MSVITEVRIYAHYLYELVIGRLSSVSLTMSTDAGSNFQV